MKFLLKVLKREERPVNKSLKDVWNVTKWEFTRFFKWQDMIKGTLFMLGFALIGGLFGYWVATDTITIPEIAVHEYGSFSKEEFQSEAFRFIDRSGEPMDVLAEDLAAGELDGILTIATTDSAAIRMQSERGWVGSLRGFLSELRTEQKLQEFHIDPSVYSEIEERIVLHTGFESGSASSSADKWVAGIAIFLVLTAVFIGFGYQFTTITGEKQMRITEQVVSAIHPQTWIDGKILGISGIGLTYVLYYGALGMLSTAALVHYAGAPFGQALALISPGLLVVFLLFFVLGVLMINSFLAGMAATIDDPNTSQKAGWMMLPIFPVVFSIFTIFNPDGFAIKLLGIFPLTSYAVLPARMVLTQVAWWEPVVALILLAATAWLFRKWAGKIFATGMMMYGKEPTFKEMIYWFRKS